MASLWIATSWLATGLYVGPAVSGHEPKFQRLGVNVLFGALILVVGGSLAGEWLGIQQRLGNQTAIKVSELALVCREILGGSRED
jgi:nitric oxide reductase subunit B